MGTTASTTLIMCAVVSAGVLAGCSASVPNATTTQATVTLTEKDTNRRKVNGRWKTSEVCRRTATYTVNGASYTETDGFWSSTYCWDKKGDTVTLEYDAQDPGNARIVD